MTPLATITAMYGYLAPFVLLTWALKVLAGITVRDFMRLRRLWSAQRRSSIAGIGTEG